MKCPKCGYKIPSKKIAADLGKKGGSVKSLKKSEAAKKREERKRHTHTMEEPYEHTALP